MISGLLIITPPIAIWCTLSRQTSARAAWLYPALALMGPYVAAFVFVVLMWLPAYSGQCGGWLGETSPCSDFGQYARETMYWATMSTAMPGLLGILLGIAVLFIILIRRGMSRMSRRREGTMAYFRCLIRGEGFLGILEGRGGPIGFYVNRSVQAFDAEQARLAVIEALKAELVTIGWADRGGRLIVDEIDEIDASELPLSGQGFVVFPDEETGAEQGTVDLQTPFLLIGDGGFSVQSGALTEPLMMTRDAMSSFRNAVCYDGLGRTCTIIEVIPIRQVTLCDRLLPWRQIPARFVFKPGPDLSLAEVRAKLLLILRGDSEIADFLKLPVDDAITRLNEAKSPFDLIEAAQAIV